MLWTAFILGLAGSFHCIGMCGPIAFVIPVDRTNKVKAGFQTILYHVGRLLTYSLIGLLFGIIGKGLYLAGFQQRLSILMGAIMILIVLLPNSVSGSFKIAQPFYRAIGLVKQKMGLYLSKKSNKSIFFIGFFNGFLPCGLVYMAVLGAISSGNYSDGLLYMLLFGLGTVPMMTAAVMLGNFVTVKLRNKIQKAIPVFVIVIGILFILRGLGLGIPYLSPSDAKLQLSNNPIECVSVE